MVVYGLVVPLVATLMVVLSVASCFASLPQPASSVAASPTANSDFNKLLFLIICSAPPFDNYFLFFLKNFSSGVLDKNLLVCGVDHSSSKSI